MSRINFKDIYFHLDSNGVFRQRVLYIAKFTESKREIEKEENCLFLFSIEFTEHDKSSKSD